MSDAKPARVPLPQNRCQHVVCKGMYVFGDEYLTQEHEEDRTSSFWCVRTQTGMGPDGGLVLLSQCVAGRDCFEEI